MRSTPERPAPASVHDPGFTFAQALASGWTAWDLERGLRDEALARLAQGVYAFVTDLEQLDPRQRHAADVRAVQLSRGRRWAAARRSTLYLQEIPLIGEPPAIPQLVRDPGGKHGQGRNRHERVAWLPDWQTEEVDGLVRCTLARGVVDVARREVFRNGVVVADAALRAGATKEEMRRVLAGMRRWPGVERAREVVDFADARAESPGESIGRVACHLEGLPIPEPQVEVWRDGHFVARLDGLFREELLALETDGAMKFDGSGVLPALLDRDERIRDCGIEVVHTGWTETFSRTRPFGDRMRARLAGAHLRRLAPGVVLRSTTAPQRRAA